MLLSALAVSAADGGSTAEKRLEALAMRTRALREEVTKANGVSPAQRKAFDRLVADVEAYNKKTRRFDVSVERALSVTRCDGPPAFSARMIDTGNPSCTLNCPFFPPNRPKGYFCLPDGQSFCDPLTGNTVCSYQCVRIPFSDLFDSDRGGS